MGCKAIVSYAIENGLHEEVCLAQLADEHRRKTGEEPVIAVDGVRCVWYLYLNCDMYCGGQYKEFREACRNFVQKIRNCGVRLVFFFKGRRPAEKSGRWEQISRAKVGKVNRILEKWPVRIDNKVQSPRLPEGVIPCARVMFREEASTEVRLSMGDCKKEAAQYAARSKNCLGVMASNGDFLIYRDVPSLFLFDDSLNMENEVRILRIRSSDIASRLGIQQRELAAFATFSGNGTISSGEQRRVHRQLHSRYGCNKPLASVVAELVKDKTVEEMCQIAFGDRWTEFLKQVEAGIRQYAYKRIPERPVQGSGSKWSDVLHCIEKKHSSGELPAVVLSVAWCQIFRLGAVLEDLAQTTCEGGSTAEVLQPMRRRMYTVVLWESGEGPFYVEEQMTRRSQDYKTHVEVQKRLPPSVTHPGLLQLWSGDMEMRWRLFSWIVGAPDPEGSALRSLEPQYLVVPAAALHFLRHKARLLEHHEVEVFALVAATLGTLSPQQLAKKNSPTLDPRAVYVATLFVRTALHVLDAAAVCGLSFPTESDCQLDAYFDGKFFHELYLKAKDQSFVGIGTHANCDPSCLPPIHKLLAVIEGTHTGSQ